MQEVCLGHMNCSFEQAAYPENQWTHSILDEHTFLNEWRANINGIDLAFEVSQMLGSSFAKTPIPKLTMPKIASSSHVQFAESVELYVGHEHDWHLQFWRHEIEVPVDHADIFHPLHFPLSDETSFMATTQQHRPRAFGPHPHEHHDLMQDVDIGIEPGEELPHDDDMPAPSDDDNSVTA